MSEFKFFMPTKQLFGYLKTLRNKYEFNIFFNRFKSNDHEAGYYNVDISDDLHHLYLDGGFSQIFISIGSIPKSAKDWDFYEDNYEDLIVILGCRQINEFLEYSAMRLIAKKSKAKKLFGVLTRYLKAKMDFGELFIKETNYPKFYYVPSVLDKYVLTNNIYDKDSIFKKV